MILKGRKEGPVGNRGVKPQKVDSLQGLQNKDGSQDGTLG